MTKTFDFKTQLVLGGAAEEEFLELYPQPLSLSLDRRWDFNRLSDGARVELKCDSYCPEKYRNFAFERWGNIDEKKPGGPWRAKKDKVALFIYYFVKTREYWEFTDLHALVKLVDKDPSQYKQYIVKNRSWESLVYAVPRVSVEHLATKYVLKNAGNAGSTKEIII